MRIALDADLFARIADLHARRTSLGLAVDQLRLLERYHLRFVRSGALLRPEQKERMASISERLASLHTQFGQNVLHDERDWQLVLDEKDRQAQYDLDEAEVKPYFVLDNMVRAAFDTAGRLFGLAFTKREDLCVYHPDVRVWEVRDRAGAHLGLFLHDNFARPGKQSGAWSSRYRDQESMDEPVAPIVVNNNNFARGNVAGGEPTLLSFDDARTLFHEFGHGLHALLSRVRYRSQSGTSVLRDFVEFPSQIFEHWVSAPEILRTYARHCQTGEPIPPDLLRRLLAARTFDQGFATVEFTASALLDLELHRAAPDLSDLARFEREFLDRMGVPKEIGL